MRRLSTGVKGVKSILFAPKNKLDEKTENSLDLNTSYISTDSELSEHNFQEDSPLQQEIKTLSEHMQQFNNTVSKVAWNNKDIPWDIGTDKYLLAEPVRNLKRNIESPNPNMDKIQRNIELLETQLVDIEKNQKGWGRLLEHKEIKQSYKLIQDDISRVKELLGNTPSPHKNKNF